MVSITCVSCGNVLGPNLEFCLGCGKAVSAAESNARDSTVELPPVPSSTIIEVLHLLASFAFVATYFLVAEHVLALDGELIRLSLPLVMGVAILIFQSNLLIRFVELTSRWIERMYGGSANRKGRLWRFVFHPFVAVFFYLAKWTNGIPSKPVRCAIRLTSYLYAAFFGGTLFIFAMFTAAYLALMIVGIVITLWILYFVLSEMYGSSPSPPNLPVGVPGSRTVREGFFTDEEMYHVDDNGRVKTEGILFDKETGYRVDEKGSLYKEGFFFDEKLHEIGSDGTIMDVTGILAKDTGYRIDNDGKVMKKGIIFDKDTEVRVKR